MDIAETFAQNTRIQKAFGKDFDGIAEIQMTKAVAKATPLDEILQKLGFTVVEYLNKDFEQSTEFNLNRKTIFINGTDSPFRKRYDTAYLLGMMLQPDATHNEHLAFANDLLMPEASIRLAVSEYIVKIGKALLDSAEFEDMLKFLSYIFEVNPHALDIRLHQVLGTDLHY